MDKSFRDALSNLARVGNSFGAAPQRRPDWTSGLKFSIKDARRQRVGYLWFVGDFASFNERAIVATRAAATVFHRAGLDFGILRERESNSGNDVRLAGKDKLFESLHDRNVQALAKARFDAVVTTDPHSFQALKYEYPEIDGGRAVWHHTQVLVDAIASGTLQVHHKLRQAVTYHDPCYLGRYNAIFGAPRRLIAALGLTLIEMPRNRTYSYCCGAGGGRIWMGDPPMIRERPALARVREASMLQGVRTLVVACPKDLVMFDEAIRDGGLGSRIEVREVAELVEEATR